MSLLYDFIKELLLSYKLYPKIAIHGAALGTFLFLIVLSVILFYISRAISIRIISRLVRRTKSLWGVFLYQHRVFRTLTHFFPAVLIYSSSGFANLDLPWLPGFVLGIARLYIVVVFISASLRFLDAAQDIYETYPYANERSIKGYIQLIQILIYCAGGIFILAILMGQNPASILAGLGALTAILAFVFKDPILGFVASIQLAANKMVKQGDWITIPQRDIDGTVMDITLTTVKIQNWDKTITTIPTYSLVSEPMKNWIGMVESGGRRVQKSINIDMTSVKFCDKALIDKLKKAPFLFNFFKSIHTEDLKQESRSLEIQFTNLTLFKKYLENFIDTHPSIHQELTKMVRLLPSNERGLPVEITFFSKIQEAMGYEKLQSSIFDHVIAIIPEFDLRVFQNPSGNIFYPSGNHQNVGNLVRNS